MKVLFVCSGNTCRSPMAQGYLSSKNIKSIDCQSAGFISEGDKVSDNAVSVMKEIGVDISAHTSRLITKDMFTADKVFCMSESHKSALISAGMSEDKVFVLSGGISDPFGRDTDAYRKCRDEITGAIDRLLYAGKILPTEIFTAAKDDAAEISSIEKECFSSPWSENAIIEAMNCKTVFFGALSGGKTVGYISVTAVAGEGYINNIAVKKENRGKGVGSLLLDRAITFGKENKLEFLSLEVRESNAAAISLYRKAEFKKEGIRKNFYQNPREDGVVMTRRFNHVNTFD